MRIQKIIALLLAVLTLIAAVSCSAPELIVRPKRGICEIPDSDEALAAAVSSVKRYNTCYLQTRKVETVGSCVSSDCAVLVRKLVYGSGRDQVTGYVADVYIDSMEQFIGYVCRTDSGKLTKKPASDALADTGALLLINSDFLTARSWGLYVRGGSVIRDKGTKGVDICTVDKNGKMRVFDGDGFDSDAALRDPELYHIFSFGPSLLNDDGSARSEDAEFHITDSYSKWNNYESSVGFPVPNPRTAIGQAKDGHFIFVTVDGRMWGKSSRGVNFPELSHILFEEGAVVAYNMDGGGSEIMVFKGEELTKQYSEDAKRTPSDYICIVSGEYAE